MTGPPVGAGLGGRYRGEVAGQDLGTTGDIFHCSFEWLKGLSGCSRRLFVLLSEVV